MASGGVVIDVCKCKRTFRRYRAYDIRVVRDEIPRWDIVQEFVERSEQ